MDTKQLEALMVSEPALEPLVLPLTQMILLPSTEKLLEIAKGGDGYHGRRLQAGRQRDALQRERPEGCWCLGVGGKETRSLATGVEVFDTYCPCPDGQKLQGEHKGLRSKAKYEKEAADIWACWQKAEIPALYQGFRLSEHPIGKTDKALVARLQSPPSGLADNDAEWERLVTPWMGSWYFWGPVGIGKTGLAVSYAREYVIFYGGDFSILYRSVPDLLTELRSTYGRHEGESEADVLAKYRKVELLILDELGVESDSGSGWLQDRLYQVIGGRHADNMPTIFTSNLSIAQLSKKLGERIAWRVVEMCGQEHIIEVKGPNLRDKGPAKPKAKDVRGSL